MKKILMFVLVAVAFAMAAPEALAQVRVQGRVIDSEGEGVPNAKITLHSTHGGAMAPITADKRGEWATILQVGGTWNIDIEAEGFLKNLGTIQLSEARRNPKIKSVMERRPEPKPQPEEVVAAEPGLPQEVVDAVHAGEAFMRKASGKDLIETRDEAGNVVESRLVDVEMPSAEEQKALFGEAAEEFEIALAGLPEHLEIKKAAARAHYGAGNLSRAITLLDEVLAEDPENVPIALLQVNLLAESDELDRAQALLDSLPPASLDDPMAVINVGILFLNKGRAEVAWEYFDRAVAIDPSRGESYYYRGIASLQRNNLAEAKADFQKVIELAPETTEADDARGLLAQM